MYLALAITGHIFLAITFILDKFILTKAIQKPVVFVFYSTVIALSVLLLVPFGVEAITNPTDLLVALGAGFSYALALWSMYRGFQASEVSHAAPLIGATTPFFVLILGQVFLKEVLSRAQLWGIFLLIGGSLLISFQKSQKNHGFNKSLVWGLMAGLLFSIVHVSSKYLYGGYGFLTGFVWVQGAMGLFGVILLLSPTVRSRVFSRSKKQKIKSSKKFGLVLLEKLLALAALLLIQYAVSLGSVTIVNALSGVQFAFLVVAVALLSKFAPKLFKEHYNKGELAREMVAVAVIAVGLGLIIF